MDRRKRSPSRRRFPLRFRDREAVLNTLHHHLHAAQHDAEYLRVINLVGLGGAGKTYLLDEFAKRIRVTAPDVPVLRLSLGADPPGDVVPALIAIREQAPSDCLLFDCALYSYWTATGRPFSLRRGGRMADGLAVQAIEAGSSVLSVPLPLKFAIRLYESAHRAHIRRTRYKRSDFQEIDELREQPSILSDRLARYLGLDIRTAAGASRQHAFLIDAFDSRVSADGSWLQDLVATVDSGIWVITSRESISWPSQDWNDVLEELDVAPFPETLAREIVTHETNASPQIIDHIVAVARGLPFYIEGCIRDYEYERRPGGHNLLPRLARTREEVLDRMFSHLSKEEREGLTAVAIVGVFDERLFRGIIRSLNVPLSFAFWDDLVVMYFVTCVAGHDGLYQTHDLLTDFVRRHKRYRTCASLAFDAVTQDVLLRCHSNPTDTTVLPLFTAALDVARTRAGLSDYATERLIDIGYLLYDAGMWRELAACSNGELVRRPRSGDVIAHFFWALCARRQHTVDVSRQALYEVESYQTLLGNHAPSLDLERGYLEELAGQYDKSRKLFASLHQSTQIRSAPERTRVRAALYYADMLIMDGSLKRASDQLLELSEQSASAQPIEVAELLRHRAHAFRFSLLFEDAVFQYLRAYELAAESPGFGAKLLGNLAESRCWFEPAHARENANEALVLNAQVGNQIEIGKNHAALAVAEAALSRPEDAERHARQAITIAEQTGYPAGALFGEIGVVAACTVADRIEDAEAAVARLRHATLRLGTYHHLMVLALALVGRYEESSHYASQFEWLEPDTVDDRVRAAASTLRQ